MRASGEKTRTAYPMADVAAASITARCSERSACRADWAIITVNSQPTAAVRDPSATVNGESAELADGTTVAELVESRAQDRRRVAVALALLGALSWGSYAVTQWRADRAADGSAGNGPRRASGSCAETALGVVVGLGVSCADAKSGNRSGRKKNLTHCFLLLG